MGVVPRRSALVRGSRRASVEPDQPGSEQLSYAGGFPSAPGGSSPRDTGSSNIGASTCGSLDRGSLEMRLSRRRLLGVGIVAMSSVVLAGPPMLRAATPTTVWGLDPDGARGGCGCSACSACRSHAHYKLFASSADADTGRAHPFCRCEIVSLGTLDATTYSTLFLRAGGRPSVDTRHAWVQTALAASPSPPPSPSVLNKSESGQPTEPSSKPAATPVKPAEVKTVAATARLRAAWVRRLGPDRRAVFVQLEASRPLEATIALHRHGRPIARRTLTLAAGRQTVRLPLATTVRKGPATVRVRFAAVPGSAKREVSVPAKLPPSA
jgi:hypothetical protein